ncbi:MAG: DNRLRE domain-containing protein, partial [Anaerovoracaceae bacterium]
MKGRKLKQIIVFTVILCMAVTTMPIVGFASELPQAGQQDYTGTATTTDTATAADTADDSYIALEEIEPVSTSKDISQVTAQDIILEESNESITTFDLGGGKKAKIFYSYNVRYRDDEGNLVDIEPELVSISGKTVTEQGETLAGYKYENKSGKIKNYIPETVSEKTPVIMENGDYSITMAPTGYLNSILAKSKEGGKGKVKEDIVRDIDNSNKNKKVKMVFGDESDEAYLEYISLNEGIKENIVLNEIPKKNEFTFKLKIKGMSFRMNDDNNGITFYDKNTGEIAARIEAPFMNDASGEAYSEDITYSMSRQGNSDNYTLTVAVSEEYLKSQERVYPVTIDPTATWNNTTYYKDVYVNSSNPNTNYYGSIYKAMPAGRGSTGSKYRTYIKFLELKAQLLGSDVTDAKLECYENGDGRGGYVVRAYKILEDWNYSNVTWNTVPNHGTEASYLDAITSSGVVNRKQTFDLTGWVQSVAAGGRNFGIVIKNQVESSYSYVEFYGSRTSSTSYRPRLTVYYTPDKPATPSSVTSSKGSYVAGENISVTWSGVTANNLDHIEYHIARCDSAGNVTNENYVPYTRLTGATSSGTAIIPNSSILPTGYYDIYIRGVSTSGAKGTGASCRVQICENRAPTLQSMTVMKGSVAVGDASYISPGDLSVTVNGISDEFPIEGTNLSYSIYGPNQKYVAMSLTDSNIYEYETGKYRATFTIPQSEISQSGTYSLFFRAADNVSNVGQICQSFLIDADCPTGSISVSNAQTAMETDKLEGMNKIAVNVNDAHSGVENSILELYNRTMQEPGIKAATLLTNSSIPKLLDFNSYDYADGNYTLKLTVIDKAGQTVTAWKDITIDNRIAKPIIGVSISSGNSSLNVQWSYQEEMSELDYIQYSLDGSDLWTDVTITGKTGGSFTVPLPEGAAGTHSIFVRGMDTSGEYGESTRYDFNIDSESPIADITGINRGIVSGTVTDDYLASWTIYVKERDDAESEYVEIASGTNAVSAGRIGMVDLSSTQYALDTWYTVKVEAIDESGNIGSDTFDVYKAADYKAAVLIKSENRILRSLGQSMTFPDFIVSSTEDALEMKNGSLFSSVLWVVNGTTVSGNTSYVADFSTYTDGAANTIAAAGKDADGNVYYSNDVYMNATEDAFSFGEPAEGVIEQTVTLSQGAVAFTLNAPTSASLAEGPESAITYYAKVGSGEYQMISPGTAVHVFSLNSQMVSADTLTVKAVSGSPEVLSQLDTFTVSLGVMDSETFRVSSAESYWPENVSAQDKINYKTYVKWNTPQIMPEGLSYEVYRSAISNFIPGELTLVTDNVTEGYWVDINTNYGISLYYKVRAVVKDAEGNIVSASSFSDLAESTPIDETEYLKALGYKDYWAYEDIATPAGGGYIEKSQGNFLYEQTDIEMANEQLPVTFTRTYNSMATGKSV